MTDKCRIIMTMMVRDEADIIAANIEHHLAQGVDLIIVTDNASTDGTLEILTAYEAKGVVELHQDPRHEKQQAEVVTKMARSAFLRHSATWVINADADEFWFAPNASSIRTALETMPVEVQSFRAPVRNLMGTPLAAGSAIMSHTWLDNRSDEALASVGLHAHPTDDCVHRGSASVEVVQGNHATNLPLSDEVPEANRLAVWHLPYRTWNQYRTRVEATAAAYARSNLTPSPRHHGMRDARWLERDELLPFFVARHPEFDATGQLITPGFVEQPTLKHELEELAVSGDAILPDLLSDALKVPVQLENVAQLRDRHRILGPWMIEAAEYRAERDYLRFAVAESIQARDDLTQMVEQSNAAREELQTQLTAAQRTNEALNSYLARVMANPVTRLSARIVVPRFGWGERIRNIRRKARSLLSRG